MNDLDGSLSVSVPITVPAGAAGMEPRLTLGFGSSDGL